MQNAAMCWTGGKDSALALYEAGLAGYRVQCLVTFTPPPSPTQTDFLAHPLKLIKMQAQALGLPHHVLPLTPPYEAAYETALCRLRDDMGITCVITGDIAPVNGHPNWIRERCRPHGIDVHTPLWERERSALLLQLIQQGFDVRFSCVNTHMLDASWVGRQLDQTALTELQYIRTQNGLDLCGEEGEYHTMVLDGPHFGRRIVIGAYANRLAGMLAYMAVDEIALHEQDG